MQFIVILKVFVGGPIPGNRKVQGIQQHTFDQAAAPHFCPDKKMMNRQQRPRKHRRRPWQGRKRRRVFTRPNRGHSIMQVICQADSALEKIAGKSLCTRSGFVKLVWAYIKRNQLQKPGKGQGRWIIPNQEFAEFMGVEGQETNGFTMSKYIEQHLVIKSLSEPKKN